MAKDSDNIQEIKGVYKNMDDILRRIGQLEENDQEKSLEINDIKTILIGPPPQRNNGIRGDLKELKEKFECHEQGDETVKVAKINLKGIYVMGVLQFAGSILIALIAGGYFK